MKTTHTPELPVNRTYTVIDEREADIPLPFAIMDGGSLVAYVATEQEAVAFAAAPDLLEALEDLIRLCGGRHGWEVGNAYISRAFVDKYDEICARFAAIARARGEG